MQPTCVSQCLCLRRHREFRLNLVRYQHDRAAGHSAAWHSRHRRSATAGTADEQRRGSSCHSAFPTRSIGPAPLRRRDERAVRRTSAGPGALLRGVRAEQRASSPWVRRGEGRGGSRGPPGRGSRGGSRRGTCTSGAVAGERRRRPGRTSNTPVASPSTWHNCTTCARRGAGPSSLPLRGAAGAGGRGAAHPRLPDSPGVGQGSGCRAWAQLHSGDTSTGVTARGLRRSAWTSGRGRAVCRAGDITKAVSEQSQDPSGVTEAAGGSGRGKGGGGGPTLNPKP